MIFYVVSFTLLGTTDINNIVFTDIIKAYDFYETFPKNYRAAISITEINTEDYQDDSKT